MRTREEIEEVLRLSNRNTPGLSELSTKFNTSLTVELLIDIRDLLQKQTEQNLTVEQRQNR